MGCRADVEVCFEGRLPSDRRINYVAEKENEQKIKLRAAFSVRDGQDQPFNGQSNWLRIRRCLRASPPTLF